MPPTETNRSRDLPQEWRIPPWQAAVLVLVATGLLALDLNVHLSPGALIMTGIIAAASLFGAVVALRYLLVADDDGIWVRHLFRTDLVEWNDVKDVEMTVGRRNATTIRITRVTGAHVDVPPSLLLPTLPTKMSRVRSIMHGTATHLKELAAARRG
ncbi:MAG TPA: PH domain-containing protein [Jatrophihabitans sp.]|uniref:PH domain-containing protein n=1 Tax=Jatrophihabitans sp. TaxID=1932789 RepID=UPI002DFB2ABF|nr:PH domain-containing protein [Jatrophihabitans sp.]